MRENLVVQRYSNNLIAQLRLKPEQYLKPLDIAYFTDTFKYSDNPFWQQYIIDLDDPAEDCFIPDNPLYRYTPRIFRLNGDTPIYYTEILRSRLLTQSRDFTSEIERAVAYCLEQGIDVNYTSTDDISIIEERDSVKIRFKQFSAAQAEVL